MEGMVEQQELQRLLSLLVAEDTSLGKGGL